MLTRAEKIRVRHHLGIPAAGSSNVNINALLIHEYALKLEYYMNSLGVEEQAMLTGKPYASLVMYGQPQAGQSFTVVVNGAPYTYVTTSAEATAKLGRLDLANGLANAINSGTGTVACGTQFNVDDKEPPQQVPVGVEIGMFSLNGQAFTLGVQQDVGSCALMVEADVSYIGPDIAAKDSSGNAIIVHGYLPICDQLEKEILAGRKNLSVLSAGEGKAVTFRPTELVERNALYRYFTAQLGILLGVGPDPLGRLSGGSGRVIV